MSDSIFEGAVVGPNRFLGTPFLSQRNLVKFHLMYDPKRPPSLLFRKWYRVMASGPFTLILEKMGNVTPFSATNAAISSAVPGS